jgi:hypothetical protein
VVTVTTRQDGKTPEQLEADLIGSTTPPEVLQAVGSWLAHRLGADGFEWRSSRSRLESVGGGRSERIVLEGSRHNRAGLNIQIRAVRLTVTDKALADWRSRNPELTVDRPPSVADIVCGSSYLDLSRNSAAILTVPEARIAAAERLGADLEAVALPWFATLRDPAVLAGAAPAAVLRPTAFAQDLLEFLVSRELTGPAQALIGRFTSISPEHEAAFAEGLELARDGGRPDWHTPPALGWSSRVLGLA